MPAGLGFINQQQKIIKKIDLVRLLFKIQNQNFQQHVQVLRLFQNLYAKIVKNINAFTRLAKTETILLIITD